MKTFMHFFFFCCFVHYIVLNWNTFRWHAISHDIRSCAPGIGHHHIGRSIDIAYILFMVCLCYIVYAYVAPMILLRLQPSRVFSLSHFANTSDIWYGYVFVGLGHYHTICIGLAAGNGKQREQNCGITKYSIAANALHRRQYGHQTMHRNDRIRFTHSLSGSGGMTPLHLYIFIWI